MSEDFYQYQELSDSDFYKWTNLSNETVYTTTYLLHFLTSIVNSEFKLRYNGVIPAKVIPLA